MEPDVLVLCEPLFEQLRELRSSWPGAEWSWDGRFSTVASSFASSLEAAARASAAPALPQEWTATTVATASAPIRALAERTGGLRAGQRLLASDRPGDVMLYGLWWPWGGGATITLRIGIAARKMPPPLPQLRELFGVTT